EQVVQYLLQPEPVCQHGRGVRCKRVDDRDTVRFALVLQQALNLLPALHQIGFAQSHLLLYHMLAKARQQGADALRLQQRGRKRLRHGLRISLELSLRPLDPGLHGGKRLVNFMDNARGDLPQRVKPGMLIIAGALLGLLPLFALPEHASHARNRYPPRQKEQQVRQQGNAEPVRLCLGCKNEGLGMLRESALPAPESAGGWRTIAVRDVKMQLRKAMAR